MISTIIQKITAFILVFILLIHNINTLAIIGDFVVNQDFIAKTLCIQKEDQKGCQGKCHLRKELKENASNSNSNVPIQESKRLVLDVFYLSDISIIKVNDLIILDIKKAIIARTSKIIKMYLEVDTPPPNYC